MKLNIINHLNPKHLFRISKHRSSLSRSAPPSFASSSSSAAPTGASTPTTVLPHSTADIRSELAQAFRLLDRDNDGLIPLADLDAVLVRLLGAVPESTIDGGDSISVEDLANRIGSGIGSDCEIEELREAFEVFDEDGDGRISAEELLRVFAAIGDERCTLEECRRMIGGVDRNGDGFVCFEDFSRMMELKRPS